MNFKTILSGSVLMLAISFLLYGQKSVDFKRGGFPQGTRPEPFNRDPTSYRETQGN